MSEAATSQSGVDERGSETGLTPKQRRILTHLRNHVHQQTYFKSRLIGDTLGLSAKEVGSNITRLQDDDVDISIERWGFSSGTTWKVSE